MGRAWANFSFLSKFLSSCHDKSSLHEFLCFVLFFFFWRTSLHTAQTRCVGGPWSNLDFVSNFLASCFYKSLLHKFLWFFSDVLGRMLLKLDGWVKLEPTLFFGVVFWRVVMIGARCTSFFCFIQRTSSHTAQTWGWEDLGPTGIYEVTFWLVLMTEVPCMRFFFCRWLRLHVAQTWWVGELRIMKLFCGEFLWEEFLEEFSFLGEVLVVTSYLGEFLCFLEVLG